MFPAPGRVNAQLIGLGLVSIPAPVAGSKGFDTVQGLSPPSRSHHGGCFGWRTRLCLSLPALGLVLMVTGAGQGWLQLLNHPKGRSNTLHLGKVRMQGRRNHSWRRGNKTNHHWTIVLVPFMTPLTGDALPKPGGSIQLFHQEIPQKTMHKSREDG